MSLPIDEEEGSQARGGLSVMFERLDWTLVGSRIPLLGKATCFSIRTLKGTLHSWGDHEGIGSRSDCACFDPPRSR